MKLTDIYTLIIQRINLHHKRDRLYVQNVLLTFFFQGFSALASIFIIPLSLRFLNQELFGLWLVISSFFSWVAFSNLGLGNGLKFKLVSCFSLNNRKSGREYTSTTYLLTGILTLTVLLAFLIINHFMNWIDFFNASNIEKSDVEFSVYVCVIVFSLFLTVNNIDSILSADQKVGLLNVLSFIKNIIILVLLVCLPRFINQSLFAMCCIMLIPGLVVNILASVFFFSRHYRDIAPSIRSVNLSLSRGLVDVGGKFFIIQIAMVVLFSTDNIIITKLFSPSLVTPYNISLQYMGFASAIFFMILNPSMMAFAEAGILRDLAWIVKTLKRLVKLWVIFCCCLALMVAISPFVYRLWIGPEVEIPQRLTALMAVSASLTCWNSLFGSYNIGTGKLNLIMMLNIIIIVINIPLSIFFAGVMKMGPEGVILASILCMSLGAVLIPAQTYLILHEKADYFWNR